MVQILQVKGLKQPLLLELVSKELNHLVAILHFYAGSLIFIKQRKIVIIFQKENGNTFTFSKRKGKYLYSFNHFYSEKSSKRAK